MTRNAAGKTFGSQQLKTIIVLMVGYAMFYLVRKNLSFAMPVLGAEFGITKTQLGLFLTLHGIIYGLSRFVVGIITDRGSARKVMTLGLFLCATVNILFGVSDWMARLILGISATVGDGAALASVLVYIMGTLWMVNGFLQGMGVPPCTKTLTQWIRPEELATKMSIWNMSHSIGAGLAIALCGWLVIPHLGSDLSSNPEAIAAVAANLGLGEFSTLDGEAQQKVLGFVAHYGAWRWCFLIPAAVALLGSVYLFFTMKDSPSDAGFPEIVGKKKAIVKNAEEAKEHAAFVYKHVYTNRIIWTLALANFFVYVVRFACLDWGPTFLTEDKGLSMATATTLMLFFEFVGGNLGMVFWGWATDHLFHSKAHHTSLVCMVGATLAVLALWKMPEGASWLLLMLVFMLIGFFIYGPQALLGICAAQHATNRASATANGILGIFGYASTIISGVGFGYVADHYGWDGTYLTVVIASTLTILVLASIWTAKATGYDE